MPAHIHCTYAFIYTTHIHSCVSICAPMWGGKESLLQLESDQKQRG